MGHMLQALSAPSPIITEELQGLEMVDIIEILYK